MPFIDWSDPDEMFGLLVELVADERSEADDAARRGFLSQLKQDLEALQELFPRLAPSEQIAALRAIHTAVEAGFENDPAVEHIGACTEELERINENKKSGGRN